MTTVNPLQSALQNAYSQLNNQVQSNRPGQVEADVMRFFGAPASLLQDLRNDLKAVTDGPNPHRAVDNLLTGLQKLEMFTAGPSIATEMPAGREPSIGDKFFVKGENGEPKEVPMAKEMPAGREPSVGDKFFVKGADGRPEEILLDAKADNVILSLKKLLDANATGTDIQQAVATLSSTLQGLTGAIANDSEKLKAALLNSIRSQS